MGNCLVCAEVRDPNDDLVIFLQREREERERIEVVGRERGGEREEIDT